MKRKIVTNALIAGIGFVGIAVSGFALVFGFNTPAPAMFLFGFAFGYGGMGLLLEGPET